MSASAASQSRRHFADVPHETMMPPSSRPPPPDAWASFGGGSCSGTCVLTAMSSHDGTGRWVTAYWTELYPHGVEHRAAGPGWVCLPPPANDLTFLGGLWQQASAALGTLLDQFEADELSPEQCAMLASIVRQHADVRYSPLVPGTVVAEVGSQIAPTVRPIVAEVDAAEMVRQLSALAGFLEDAARLRKRVTIDL